MRFAIDIIIEKKGRFAYRTWPAVPCVGDDILLEGERVTTVKKVVWGESRDYDCWIQLVCGPVRSLTPKPRKKKDNPHAD